MSNFLIQPSFEYDEGNLLIKNDSVTRELLATIFKENNINLNRIHNILFNIGVTTVNKRIFRKFPNIEKVILSNTVKKIENDAFRDCKSLKTIYIYGENIDFSEAMDAFRDNNHLEILVVSKMMEENILKYKELLGLNDFNIVIFNK